MAVYYIRRTSKVEEQFSSAFKNDHKSFALDLLRLVVHLSKVCCQSERNCCLVLVMIWSFQVCTQKTFYPIVWQHYADTLFSAPGKDQLISKCLFWCLQFSQKNERKQFDLRYHSRKLNFFVRFLGELKIPKRHFEINWPFFMGLK